MAIRIKIKITLFILIAILSAPKNVVAQNGSSAITDSAITKHSIAIGWNTASLLNNYPSFLFSAQYLWKEKISLEFGGSNLLNSEIFISNGAHTEHKHGFKLVGEIKYYYDNALKNKGLYVGVGYSHLESTFQADYIVRVIEEDQRYFRLIDEEYLSKIDQFYVKLGYRFTLGDERMFIETGINLGIKIKTLTPQPSDFGGILVTNENFVQNLSRFPLPISIDAKLGFVIFK